MVYSVLTGSKEKSLMYLSAESSKNKLESSQKELTMIWGHWGKPGYITPKHASMTRKLFGAEAIKKQKIQENLSLPTLFSA